MDGSDVDEGVGAFARGLEHINLGWAFAGACLRLPGIKHLVQILLEGGGLGPRSIPRRSYKPRFAAVNDEAARGPALPAGSGSRGTLAISRGRSLYDTSGRAFVTEPWVGHRFEAGD
jgi:hypothetical protein